MVLKSGIRLSRVQVEMVTEDTFKLFVWVIRNRREVLAAFGTVASTEIQASLDGLWSDPPGGALTYKPDLFDGVPQPS